MFFKKKKVETTEKILFPEAEIEELYKLADKRHKEGAGLTEKYNLWLFIFDVLSLDYLENYELNMNNVIIPYVIKKKE